MSETKFAMLQPVHLRCILEDLTAELFVIQLVCKEFRQYVSKYITINRKLNAGIKKVPIGAWNVFNTLERLKWYLKYHQPTDCPFVVDSETVYRRPYCFNRREMGDYIAKYNQEDDVEAIRFASDDKYNNVYLAISHPSWGLAAVKGGNLEIFKYLLRVYTCNANHYMTEEDEGLQDLYRRHYDSEPRVYNYVRAAVECGHINILEHILEHIDKEREMLKHEREMIGREMPYGGYTMADILQSQISPCEMLKLQISFLPSAAENGHLNMIEWIWEKFMNLPIRETAPIQDEFTRKMHHSFQYAVRNRHRNILEWLQEHGFRDWTNKEVALLAVEQTDMWLYLMDNKGRRGEIQAWDVESCVRIALNFMNPDILKWIDENVNYDWSSKHYKDAFGTSSWYLKDDETTIKNCIKVMRFLREEKGLPWPSDFWHMANRCPGDVLDDAVRLGCPLDRTATEENFGGYTARAALEQNLPFLQWLRKEKCDWGGWTLAMSPKDSKFHTWAKNNNAPEFDPSKPIPWCCEDCKTLGKTKQCYDPSATLWALDDRPSAFDPISPVVKPASRWHELFKPIRYISNASDESNDFNDSDVVRN